MAAEGYTVDVYDYLFKNYIKYDMINALSIRAFTANYHDCMYLNVLIDMHSLLEGLYRTDINFTYKSENCIAASMINMCAHMRNYYRSYRGVECKFYLIWSKNRPANVRAVIPEYNAHQIMAEDSNTIMTQLIEKNIGILKLITRYIPGIYVVDGGDEEAYVVETAIMAESNVITQMLAAPTVIISKDPLNYLTVSTNPATVMFRPKKANGEDKSYLVTKKYIHQSYITQELKNKYDEGVGYCPFLTHLIFSGIKCRGVNGVCKYKAVKDKAMFSILSAEEQTVVTNNTIATNVPNRTQALIDNTPTLFENIVDLYDPEQVKELNNKEFTVYPLDLNVL